VSLALEENVSAKVLLSSAMLWIQPLPQVSLERKGEHGGACVSIAHKVRDSMQKCVCKVTSTFCSADHHFIALLRRQLQLACKKQDARTIKGLGDLERNA
jgi:hypothetical protein